jgi:diguanylate cyclase (GGDEF)-like protein
MRDFIRRYGKWRTVAFSTLLLIFIVVILTALIDLILFNSAYETPAYLSAVITLLVGPLVLYFLVSLISQLDSSEEKLQALSIIDDLTDVYNRRYFMEQAGKELAKAQRYGTTFSLLIVSVDRLKEINDKYGHIAGDAVLQSLANTCMNNLRAMDIFARFGAEEFAYLIPETDKNDVVAFAKKVLGAVEKSVVVFDHQEIRFTVSIGVKTIDEIIRSLDTMLSDANDALCEAKARGRNCIVVYDVEDIPGDEEAGG